MSKPQNPACPGWASIRSLPAVICCLAGLVLPLAAAEFNRTALMIDAPKAEVLPAGVLQVTAAGSQGLTRSVMSPGTEADMCLRFSPVKRLELAVSAYTRHDYVLNVSGLVLDGKGRTPSLAAGIHDIGVRSSVSPIGHDQNIWPDEQYPGKPDENFSAFVVGTVPVDKVGALSLGLGRGRYVGYGNHSRYLNTDYFFSGRHQWAVGLFGGAQVNLGSHVAALAEIDGRDLNAGLQANLGPVQAGIALTKIEGLLWPQGNQFHRISFAVSYRSPSLYRRPTRSPVPLPQYGSLTGRVIDRKTGLPVPAAIELAEPALTPPSGQSVTDDHGAFAFDRLPVGTVRLAVQAEGYEPASATADVKPGPAAWLDIALEPEVTENPPEPPPLLAAAPAPAPTLKLTALSLAPVMFEFDRYDLSPRYQSVLREHAQLLKSNPTVNVKILGRTCELGSDEYNLQLGEQRARTTYDYLVAQGIPPQRLSVRSLGRTIAEPGTALANYRRCDFVTEVTGK
jgi:outer membrane protein OmpA-like peptidoglycan-associated protein